MAGRTSHSVRLVSMAEELYQQGLSCREVAARLAALVEDPPSRAWVQRQLSSRGVTRSRSAAVANRTGRDYEALRSEARRLAEEGRLSVRRISKRLRVSATFVRSSVRPEDRCNPSGATWRRAWEAELPDVVERLDQVDRVVALRRQGVSWKEISRRTGASHTTVYRYLKAAGLTRRVADPDLRRRFDESSEGR